MSSAAVVWQRATIAPAFCTRGRVRSSGRGLLLDGFPRNLFQAEYLESVTEGQPIHAIHIQVEEGCIVR